MARWPTTNNAPSFSTPGAGPNVGEQLLNFDTSGATISTTLPVTIPALYPGAFVAVVVEWDQPFVTGAPASGGATSQIDVCVTGATGGDQIADDNLNVLPTGCTGANALHADPVQVLIVGNPANGPNTTAVANINIVVGLAGGTKPGRIKVAVEGDGFMLTFNKFWTPSATIQGHPGAAGAAAVGAAFFLNTPSCGTTPATLEYYSSAGGDPILFDVNGKPQAAVVRQKPDFVGPDGGNNTFLGDTLAKEQITDNSTIPGCGNNANYPNFFGTSAAAPHVASIAALLLQADPALTPAEIYSALQKSATPIGAAPAPNFAAGYGFVQADMAAAGIPAIVPAAPALSLAASSIVVNTSTTITWSSVNTTGCTASGSWSGALPSNGTQTLTPTAAGSDTYTLICANANPTPSAATSVTLSVTAAAPPPAAGSHGGGALGLSTLLGLAGLCLGRMRRPPRVADLKQPGVQGR